MEIPYNAAPVDPNLLHEKVTAVRESYLALLQSISVAPPKAVKDPINEINERLRQYYDYVEKNLLDRAVDSADAIGIFGISIANAWLTSPTLKTESTDIAESLKNISEDLRRYAASHVGAMPNIPPDHLPMALRSANEYQKKELADFQDKVQKNAQLLATISGVAERAERQLAVIEARLNALGEIADKSSKRVEQVTAAQADDFRRELNKQAGDIRESFGAVSSKISEQLNDFDGYRNQALQMLDQMAATTLSGGYIGSSAKEASEADLFRWVSLGVMSLTLVFLGWTLYQLSFVDMDWAKAGMRVAISLLMAVPTAYLARESAKHRAQAIELRRTSLDFAVLEPFLKSLEGETAAKLRAELALRVFFVAGKSEDAPSYGLDPQAIIVKGMDTIAELSKQKRS